MKSIGIVRKIDELGRIVLPKELRNSNNIFPGDDFEIYVEENKIVLEKFGKLLSKTDKIKSIFKDEKILFIINDEIINSGDKILPAFNKIVHDRKCIAINSKFKLTENIILNEGTIVYPIISESDIIGTLVFIDGLQFNDVSKIIAKIFDVL